MASSCAVKAWGRRWKRTSLAALIPDWTAPLMYPHQAVADSVPAKWILKHQNVILNLKQNQILQTLLLLFYYIMQKIPIVWSNCSHFITALLWWPEFCIMNWPRSNLIKTSSLITIYWEISTILFICTSKIKNNIYMSDLF